MSAPPTPSAAGVSDTPRPESGLRSWFESEVHPHERQLKSFLQKTFPTMGDVDDVVQESYLRLWKRQIEKPVLSAKNFLFRVARNLAVDILRGEHRDLYEPLPRDADVSALANGPDSAEKACLSQEAALLLEAIDSLPPRCREVVILCKLHGLSQREIGERLGTAEQTVQTQVAHGIQRCKKYLEDRGVVRRRQR